MLGRGPGRSRNTVIIVSVSIAFAAVFAVVLLQTVVPRLLDWHEDEPCDEFVVQLGGAAIRARRFKETGWTPASKAYSYIDVQTAPGGAWTEVLNEFGATPGWIDRETIVIVSPTTAYARFNRCFAVTTDGGASWTARNASDVWLDATGERSREHASIRGLRIASDGTGTVTVQVYMGDEHQLTTSDFGRTWQRL